MMNTSHTQTPLNSQDSRDENDVHSQRQQHQLMTQQQGSLAEMVVKAASVCNKMLLENCSLCTVYCDKQVQYETVLEPYTSSSTVGDLFHRLDGYYNFPCLLYTSPSPRD